MLAIVLPFLTRLGWKVWAILAAVLAVLAVLAGARRSGVMAERASQAATNAKVKNAQLEAAARRPRTRDDLAGRMRDGSF